MVTATPLVNNRTRFKSQKSKYTKFTDISNSRAVNNFYGRVHEFADVRVYGGDNAPNIFAVLYASSMTMTLTTE